MARYALEAAALVVVVAAVICRRCCCNCRCCDWVLKNNIWQFADMFLAELAHTFLLVYSWGSTSALYAWQPTFAHGCLEYTARPSRMEIAAWNKNRAECTYMAHGPKWHSAKIHPSPPSEFISPHSSTFSLCESASQSSGSVGIWRHIFNEMSCVSYDKVFGHGRAWNLYVAKRVWHFACHPRIW